MNFAVHVFVMVSMTACGLLNSRFRSRCVGVYVFDMTSIILHVAAAIAVRNNE